MSLPSSKPVTALAWYVLFCTVGPTSTRALADDRGCCSKDVCCCVTESTRGSWAVDESRNFRVHHRGSREQAESMVVLLEESRHALRQRWLGTTDRGEWTPKCDVFLYPTAASFQQSTGRPASSWGFADLEVGSGRVWMRRLNMRADDRERLDRVTTHELAHVVLADRFCNWRIPSWADEGIAVLSEPRDRQATQRRWLADEVAARRQLPLQAVLSPRNNAADQRSIDLFYAQSGAWIEFLLTERRQSEREVLKFVEALQSRSLGDAVALTWPGESVERLEFDWLRWLQSPTAGDATGGE